MSKRNNDTPNEFEKQNAVLVKGLSNEICDTIRKTIADLTERGVHVKGGKMEIAKVLSQLGIAPQSSARPAVLTQGVFKIVRRGDKLDIYYGTKKLGIMSKLSNGQFEVYLPSSKTKGTKNTIAEAVEYFFTTACKTPYNPGEVLFTIAEEKDIPGEEYGDVTRKLQNMDLQERIDAAAKFTPQTNLKQLTDFVRTIGIEADFTGWTLEQANKTTEEISRFIQVFPEAGCCVVREYDYNEYARSELAGNVPEADYSSTERTIRFGIEEYFKAGFKTRQEMVNSEYASNWSSYDSEYGVISHELGHSLASYIIDKGAVPYDSFVKEMERKLQELIRKQTKQGMGVLSKYGRTNWKEMLAESAASFMSNNPKPFAKEVIEIWIKHARP